MARVAHVIGNGDSAVYYQEEPRKGLKVTCNLPPFPVPDAWATCMVDFKMQKTIHKGEVEVPGEWVLGARPKIYCEKNPQYHMQHAHQIKDFFVDIPKYAGNYTDFNCGHMATYYVLRRLKAEEVHMWGFDAIFDFNMRSYTDLYINSDRGNMNNNRLITNWRPIWQKMFNQFPDVKFYLHHKHDALKFKKPNNVEIVVHGKK